MKKIVFLALSLTISFSLVACNSSTTSHSKEKFSSRVVQKSSKEESSSYIFTANESGSISKIDRTSMKVMETIELEGTVHNVQLSPNGKVLGAVVIPQIQHGGGHEGHESMKMNGFALFYDVQTNVLIQKVEVGAHPAHIVFTKDNQYALVTNNEENSVSIVDLTSYQVIGAVATGKGPHGFRISSDSQRAYIANMGEDTVSVIDIKNKKEVKKIKVGQTPVTTGITSDGKTLAVTLNSENALALVDLETEKIEKIPVGTGPAQVYIQSNDQYAWVANQGTAENPSNTVSKVDVKNKKLISTIEVGKGAHGVVTSEDNQWVYVTNMFDHTVSVIDNEKNQVVSTVNVGEVPNGITIK